MMTGCLLYCLSEPVWKNGRIIVASFFKNDGCWCPHDNDCRHDTKRYVAGVSVVVAHPGKWCIWWNRSVAVKAGACWRSTVSKNNGIARAPVQRSCLSYVELAKNENNDLTTSGRYHEYNAVA